MEPIGFFDRIKTLVKIVSDSSFFLIVLGIVFFTLILLIVNVKSKKKVIKIITAALYGVVAIIALIKYWQTFLNLGDTIVDKIFTMIYFPNYISYICMIVIAILLMITIFINKKISSFGKYSGIISFSFLIFLFVLTLETIISNEIDITSKQSIYSNETLVILVQTSTIIFGIWILLYIIDLIVNKVDNKNNYPVEQKENRDIFNKLRVNEMDAFINLDDPKTMNDDDFQDALHKYKKKTELKDLANYSLKK